jgi:hypothetical protein
MEPVTGDAPQPGETPRTEGNPWTFDPDAAWWRGDGDREQAEALAEAAARPRHPRRRPASTTPASAILPPAYGGDDTEAPFLGETVDAHAAGVQDAAAALSSPTAESTEPPAARLEKEQAADIEKVEAGAAAEAGAQADEPVAVDRNHDKKTRERWNVPEQPEQKTEQETGQETEWAERAQPADQPAGDGVPEVMVLPEPQNARNRPTVPLERGPVPGQSSGLTRLNQARAGAADLDVKRSRMENSPFWLTDQERAAAAANSSWPGQETRDKLANAPGPADGRRGRPPRSRPRSPRRSAPGLFALIALGLIAAFFSWVSAEPFWLAVGHGEPGVATVTRCIGSGVTQRCAGSFAAADGSYRTQTVTLLGVGPASRNPGAVTPARMVNPGSKQAYAGSTGILVHLRWTLGFILVLLCGLGIAGLTGTRQLESVRARRGALLMSLAGPLLLLAGFLFATY